MVDRPKQSDLGRMSSKCRQKCYELYLEIAQKLLKIGSQNAYTMRKGAENVFRWNN